MESRRKKPNGKHYGFWHQGRHGDLPVFEGMALDDAESHGETSTAKGETLTFPERRAPLWVTLSVLTAAALVTAGVGNSLISGDGYSPPAAMPTQSSKPPVATPMTTKRPAVSPSQRVPTVMVTVPGPVTTVQARVPAPAATARATPVPGPTVTVAGPTTTVTRTVRPGEPVAPVPTVTVTKEVPGPTVTVTVTETATERITIKIPVPGPTITIPILGPITGKKKTKE